MQNFIKTFLYTTTYGLLWIIALKLHSIQELLHGIIE